MGHAIAWVTRSRGLICAIGASAASRSRNSLFETLFAKILGDAIAWSTRSREWPSGGYDADAWGTRSRGEAWASSTIPAQLSAMHLVDVDFQVTRPRG